MTENQTKAPAVARFRKKPVVISAVQFQGRRDAQEVLEFFGHDFPRTASGAGIVIGDDTSGEPRVLIQTLEGVMRADPGDWIIRGVSGEYYPCKPDIFDATYERVEEAQEGGR